MTLTCHRLPFALTLAIAVMAQFVVADEADDPADLPSPISSRQARDAGSLDEIGEGPVKPRPYRWLVDDPVTPISPSTVMPFATQVDDLDPNNPLERPGIPVGWFTQLELTAAHPRLSTRQQSGNLIPGTVIAVPVVPLDWTAMPKFTLGYRRPEGLGELSASYRFLLAQGSGGIPQFAGGGTGNGSTNLQLHVLDLDYSLSDLFPNDLWLVPRQTRLTAGVRVAGIHDKTSANGGAITNQSASNMFVGAGPRFALETFYPILTTRWTLFTKFDAAGLIGNDRQSFNQTVGAATVSASSGPSTVATEVVGLRTGLNWFPDWGSGNVKMSAGYQWERWFNVGTDSSSYNELTIQGPFLQGEVAF